MCIERKTAGNHPVPRRGGAIAECPTDDPRVQFPFSQDVQRKPRVGKDHPAQSDKINVPFAHLGLRHVRQKLLKVGISRTHQDQAGMPLLDPPDDVDLTRDTRQGVFGGLVSV